MSLHHLSTSGQCPRSSQLVLLWKNGNSVRVRKRWEMPIVMLLLFFTVLTATTMVFLS